MNQNQIIKKAYHICHDRDIRPELIEYSEQRTPEGTVEKMGITVFLSKKTFKNFSVQLYEYAATHENLLDELRMKAIEYLSNIK